MPRFEKQVTVDVTPQQAFTYLSDIARHNEWTQHDVNIEGPTGPSTSGATFTSRNHFMGRQVEDKITVTELAPGQRVVYEADGSTGQFRHTFEIAASNGGSRITKRLETLRQPWYGLLLLPALYVIAPNALTGDLTRIKDRLEQGNPAA